MTKKERKELYESLKPKPRPRPLMCVGRRKGRKVYIRKQDISYFQLKEKLQLKKPWWQRFKSVHVFQHRHWSWGGGFGR